MRLEEVPLWDLWTSIKVCRKEKQWKRPHLLCADGRLRLPLLSIPSSRPLLFNPLPSLNCAQVILAPTACFLDRLPNQLLRSSSAGRPYCLIEKPRPDIHQRGHVTPGGCLVSAVHSHIPHSPPACLGCEKGVAAQVFLHKGFYTFLELWRHFSSFGCFILEKVEPDDTLLHAGGLR